MVPPVDNLIRALSKLPGLGRRSAERAALALLRKPELLLDTLMRALHEARETVCCCSLCGGFTAKTCEPCALCTDPMRDDSLLCVVEEPADIVSIERSGGFRGRYHALMGKLSPSKRTGPSDLRLVALERRVSKGPVREVLLALSTDMEGDATAGYIGEMLKPSGVRITRLAFGLPADSGVGYSDPLTLKRAISGRVVCEPQEVTEP
ncbi:MAG TPA: recombination mediator RecR [Kiritimatiellia bacterium]|jgi:recombination protein RecR|nr:recombination mediator RecR [Kiritimatiellia bacterium]HOR98593.1 recombination mediator RecR [Kiritimatiellia bacterium]